MAACQHVFLSLICLRASGAIRLCVGLYFHPLMASIEPSVDHLAHVMSFSSRQGFESLTESLHIYYIPNSVLPPFPPCTLKKRAKLSSINMKPQCFLVHPRCDLAVYLEWYSCGRKDMWVVLRFSRRRLCLVIILSSQPAYQREHSAVPGGVVDQMGCRRPGELWPT